MDYRKITKFAAITALSLGLSACAELTDGLSAINGTLAGINSGMAGSGAGQAKDTLSLGSKSTAQYELKNLKMLVVQRGGSYKGAIPQADITFTGEALNKTNRLIVVNVSVPIYDKQGYYVSAVSTDIHIPPKEKVKIDNFRTTLSLTDDNRFNIQKNAISRNNLLIYLRRTPQSGCFFWAYRFINQGNPRENHPSSLPFYRTLCMFRKKASSTSRYAFSD